MLALCSLTAFAFFDLLFFSVASSPPFLFFFPRGDFLQPTLQKQHTQSVRTDPSRESLFILLCLF